MVVHARSEFVYEMFGSAPVPRIRKKDKSTINSHRDEVNLRGTNPQSIEDKIKDKSNY